MIFDQLWTQFSPTFCLKSRITCRVFMRTMWISLRVFDNWEKYERIWVHDLHHMHCNHTTLGPIARACTFHINSNLFLSLQITICWPSSGGKCCALSKKDISLILITNGVRKVFSISMPKCSTIVSFFIDRHSQNTYYKNLNFLQFTFLLLSACQI